MTRKRNGTTYTYIIPAFIFLKNLFLEAHFIPPSSTYPFIYNRIFRRQFLDNFKFTYFIFKNLTNIPEGTSNACNFLK